MSKDGRVGNNAIDNRWTIRSVTEDARTMIEEVHEVTGIPMGRLVSDAIETWYSELDEVDPIPPMRLAAA